MTFVLNVQSTLLANFLIDALKVTILPTIVLIIMPTMKTPQESLLFLLLLLISVCSTIFKSYLTEPKITLSSIQCWLNKQF